MRRSPQDPLSLARELALPTYGLVTRHLLRTHGIDRHRLRRLTAHGEVVPYGSHAVRVKSAHWDGTRSPIVAAVMNSGASAWADGPAALILAGLTGWPLADIDVGIPENAATRQVQNVHRHRFRRPPRLCAGPVPYAEPAHAALHAAAWCESDAGAAAVLEATTMQHVAPVNHLTAMLEILPTLHRRNLMREILAEIRVARPPLHEIDLRRLCRRHGIPEPERIDLTPSESTTDEFNAEARWASPGLTLRIDAGPYPLRDELSADVCGGPTIAAETDRVLHASVATLHTHPDLFFGRLRELLTKTVGR